MTNPASDTGGSHPFPAVPTLTKEHYVKRVVLGALVAALAAGGGTALAGPGGPGPNGHNNYGLCNAYGHNGGNNNGRAFQELERAAREYDEADGNDDYTTTAEEVGAFCNDTGQHPGKGGKA